MRFEITPYVSVGPLRWDMQQGDVDAQLGIASRTARNRMGHATQYRDELSQTCIFDKSSKNLIEVSFSEKRGLVFVGELDQIAASNKDVIDTLLRMDRNVKIGFASIVFLDLGIALSGYQPNDEEIKAVSIFTRGRWDNISQNMTPYAR